MESPLFVWLAPVVQEEKCPYNFMPSTGPGTLFIHTSCHDKLLQLKSAIEKIQPDGKWDDAKKITNPFEFVFLSLQKRMHRSISSLQPLSRSFFKMIEIWDALDLKEIGATSHTAEGPGGFLEAIQYRSPGTRSIAMTLRSTEKTIPGWRKSHTFLRENPTVSITYGADNTGNLYKLVNQAAFIRASALHLKSEADLYTADGGFDFSSDYNGQENSVQRLLAAEAYAGINTLRKGGVMILKVFDTKNRATLELLWILSMCFDNTAIIKPFTSRPANSERYWIGYGKRDRIPEWIQYALQSLIGDQTNIGWNQLFSEEIIFPEKWLSSIVQIQERIEHQQVSNIQMTLNILATPKKEDIMELLKLNIYFSRKWCAQHGIPENPRISSLTNDQIAQQNLEESLVPFQVEGAHKNLPMQFRQKQMHHEPILSHSPRLPTVLAWRSTLPVSILGHTTSQKVSDIPLEVGKLPDLTQSL